MSDINESIEEFEDAKSRSEISPPEESASSATGAVIAAAEAPSGPIGHFRWVICALLFFAATVNISTDRFLAF